MHIPENYLSLFLNFKDLFGKKDQFFPENKCSFSPDFKGKTVQKTFKF